ncbi:hypothetical protein [Saccharothrix yanglingensis]|nr:hypothetical protein [Saccharothrix yanglingensis]
MRTLPRASRREVLADGLRPAARHESRDGRPSTGGSGQHVPVYEPA